METARHSRRPLFRRYEPCARRARHLPERRGQPALQARPDRRGGDGVSGAVARFAAQLAGPDRLRGKVPDFAVRERLSGVSRICSSWRTTGARRSKRLAAMPDEDNIRKEMVDFILTKKAFPTPCRRRWRSGAILSSLENGKHFSPLCLPRTVRVSVNPKTKRPYYIVHWGYYDGTANLPMVYIASLEDSSTDMVDTLVEGRQAKARRRDTAAGGRAAQPGAGAPVR